MFVVQFFRSKTRNQIGDQTADPPPHEDMLADMDMMSMSTGHHRDMIFVDGALAMNKPMANNTKATGELELMLLKAPPTVRNGGSAANVGSLSSQAPLGNSIATTTMLTVPGANNAQNAIGHGTYNGLHAGTTPTTAAAAAQPLDTAQSSDISNQESDDDYLDSDTDGEDEDDDHESSGGSNEELNQGPRVPKRRRKKKKKLKSARNQLLLNPELSATGEPADENDVLSLAVPTGFGVGQLSSVSPQMHMNGALEASVTSINNSNEKMDQATADVIISEYPAECFPEHMYKYCPTCLDETPFWIRWKEIRTSCYQFVEHKYFESLVITLILISSMALVSIPS